MEPEQLVDFINASRQQEENVAKQHITFLAGEIAGLVEALDVTHDEDTIKRIANKLRIVAHAINKPPPPQLVSACSPMDISIDDDRWQQMVGTKKIDGSYHVRLLSDYTLEELETIKGYTVMQIYFLTKAKEAQSQEND